MMNATADVMAEQQRLRWQCRRGMLELDILLESFLDDGYMCLEEDEKDLFTRLLGSPDQQLLEWLMGRETHKDECTNGLIKKIRKCDQG